VPIDGASDQEQPVLVRNRTSRDDLLRFTYKEVLDASKHQDDKIHRLLTAIAFLVTASLALGNLGGARYITARFEVGERLIPLGLLCLGVFLVGIVGVVIMLIGGLTTPLRFPGGQRSDAPEITYTTDLQAGQVYFYEIASGSLEEWHEKWDVPDADQLKKEREDSLIRETHNLAVRAEFKYARVNEAVGLLSFALLSFALAAVLVVAAALAAAQGEPLDEVAFGPWVRGSLAAVLAGYIALQVHSAVRSEALTASALAGGRNDHPRLLTRIPGRYVATAYALVAAAVPGCFVALPVEGLGRWALLAAALFLPATAFWLLLAALPQNRKAPGKKGRSALRKAGARHADVPVDPVLRESFEKQDAYRAEQERKRRRSIVGWAGAIAVAYTALGATFAWYQSQVWLLVAAYAAGGVLVVASLTAATTRQRRRAERFQKREEFRAGTQSKPDESSDAVPAMETADPDLRS
jgi:hypothetical protein